MAQWIKGQSGNPAGRPKGSRDRLTEKVYQDLVSHWAEHGLEAIERLYEDRPDLYVSAVVRLIPVHHQVAVDHRRSAIEFSTEELLDMRAKANELEAIEHQPEKVITWPAHDRKQGEPLPQAMPVVLEADYSIRHRGR